MTLAVCTMFGTLGVNPAQISLEAQAVQLDSEVANLTNQVSKFDSKIRENLNTWVDYTKLENYAPSEIEIVIPPNFDPKTLELQGEVMVEEVAETTVSPSKTVEATTVSPSKTVEATTVLPSNKTLKITQRQTPKMELENKLEKIAKKLGTKIVAEKFISPSKTVGGVSVSPNVATTTVSSSKNGIRISKKDLKPLYKSLYPSKQALQNLNKEILQEKIEFKKQENQEKLNKTISAIFEGPQVSADQWTSNSSSALVIYNRQGTIGQWAFDIRDNLLQQGSRVQLYTRSNGTDNAQRWLTRGDTSSIYLASNPNLCLDASNYLVQGSQIHLWQCHDGINQQWITYQDGTIRPYHAQNLCLDSSAGFVNKSQIHLWQCHGGDNQNWRMGENDFGNNHYQSITASKSVDSSSFINTTGHTLMYLHKDYARSNTFSMWGNRKDSNGNIVPDRDRVNGWDKKNNIGSNTYIYVDDSSDIDVSNNNYSNWRKKTVMLSKQNFDKIKYMRGWDKGWYRDYSGLNPIRGVNCASYSVALWNEYVAPNYTINFTVGYITPTYVYDSI